MTGGKPIYGGEFEGRTYQSLYPRLYRVSYRAVIAGREQAVEVVTSAIDQHHARSRVLNRPADVRGAIEAEHVLDLAMGG